MNTVAILVTLASFLFGIFTFWKNYRSGTQVERYKHVIFPLFNEIEPYMYAKSYPPEIIAKCKDSLAEYRFLAGGAILYWIDMCSNNPSSSENFISLCRIVDREYDGACKSLGIPLRSIKYRLLRKQHPNKFRRFLDRVDLLFRYFFVAILSIMYFVLIIIFVYALVSKL